MPASPHHPAPALRRLSERRILVTTFLLVFAILGGLSLSRRQGSDLESRMGLYARKGHHEGIGSPFNGVVLVARGEEIVLRQAHGFRHHQHPQPLQVEDRFLIGSITKQFTAMLVMQQVERGRLDLDASVSDYLPYFPEEPGRHLTVHRLLSHSAGLPHYEGLLGIVDRAEFSNTERTPEQYAQLIAQVDLINEPGTEFRYSSLGYVLLGAILEQTTGRTYADLLRAEITEPLGLDDTGFADDEFVAREVVAGHRFRELDPLRALFESRPGIYREASDRHQSTTYSTGGIHSTVDDLWRWSRAVRNHELLSPEATRRLLQPNLGGYAYGWFRNLESAFRRNPSAPHYTHGGALDGFRSNIALYDDGTTIIFLSNVNPVNVLRLTQNLHLLTHGVRPETFRRDLLRPEIEEDLKSYLADGGRPAFDAYYQEISRRAGYPVLPAQLAYVELATLYLREGQYPQAEAIIAELDAHYSRLDESVLNQLGYRYLERERFPEAMRYFERAVALYPHSPNAHDSLGEALRDNGQTQSAIASFERAVQLAEASNHSALPYFQRNLDQARGD